MSIRLTPTRIRQSDVPTSWGLLALRIAVGGLLLIHGIQGLVNPAGRIVSSQRLGVPFPTLTSWLSISGEFLTGLGVLVGALTVVASMCMALLMAATWLFSSIGQPLFSSEPGISGENALFFCLGGIALTVLGAGRFSIDHAIVTRTASGREQVRTTS